MRPCCHVGRAIEELHLIIQECQNTLDPPVATTYQAPQSLHASTVPTPVGRTAATALPVMPGPSNAGVDAVPSSSSVGFPMNLAAFTPPLMAVLGSASMTELDTRLVIYRAFWKQFKLSILQLKFFRWHESSIRRELESTLQSRESLTLFRSQSATASPTAPPAAAAPHPSGSPIV